uniref:Transmembrane protein 202 isoform X3 n=1 Tax=Phascolarctos cinereus TaxID=38626 RepID=A0A6P5LAC3_PHACI|nr:transmembrane protein 202 isoform X3 [Phascolarctos cinereus]
MEGPQPATEAPLGPKVLTFHIPCTQETEGDHCYQRPILPTQNHWVALLSPWQQQHLLKQTHLYIRTFCAGLCGFTLILLLCMSPMSWVQFLSAENGLELDAGLWTLCGHELCWSHVPIPPYYLQISRIFFLLSVFITFVMLAWVIRSCRDRKEPSTHLDQGVAILSLTSGIVSFFNYKTFGILPSDPDVTEILLTRRRLGINPKMWSTPETAPAESKMVVDSAVEIASIVPSLGKTDDSKVNKNK